MSLTTKMLNYVNVVIAVLSTGLMLASSSLAVSIC